MSSPAPASLTPNTAYALTLQRVALGGLFLAHAGLKLFVFTPAGTVAFFQSLGLPGALAYVTMAVEILGGLALILGIYARLVALPLALLLLGTIATVHGANGFFFNNTGGGWEFPAFWALSLIVLAIGGDGTLALRPTPTNR